MYPFPHPDSMMAFPTFSVSWACQKCQTGLRMIMLPSLAMSGSQNPDIQLFLQTQRYYDGTHANYCDCTLPCCWVRWTCQACTAALTEQAA